MDNKAYNAITDYMFENDCWFEYACEVLGFSSLDAKLAQERFDKEIAEILNKEEAA